MNTIKRKSILVAAIIGLTMGGAATTMAGQTGETVVDGAPLPTITVSFDSTALDTAEGRATVERRVQRAAEAVCGSTDRKPAGTLTLHAVARNKACYARAVNDAMAQINADSLAALD
jgi:UrcA family protein